MDPNDPVVRLCAEGMQAEAAGRPDDARALFERAWAARRDDFDACVAAHYVARHQASDAETLAWNRRALDHARAVGDGRADGLYASLHLNLGRSYEVTGDAGAARAQYALAAERLTDVPAGPYRAVVEGGIVAAHARLADGLRS